MGGQGWEPWARAVSPCLGSSCPLPSLPPFIHVLPIHKSPARIPLPETWLHTRQENRNPDGRPRASPYERKKPTGSESNKWALVQKEILKEKKKKMQGRDAASWLAERESRLSCQTLCSWSAFHRFVDFPTLTNSPLSFFVCWFYCHSQKKEKKKKIILQTTKAFLGRWQTTLSTGCTFSYFFSSRYISFHSFL